MLHCGQYDNWGAFTAMWLRRLRLRAFDTLRLGTAMVSIFHCVNCVIRLPEWSLVRQTRSGQTSTATCPRRRPNIAVPNGDESLWSSERFATETGKITIFADGPSNRKLPHGTRYRKRLSSNTETLFVQSPTTTIRPGHTWTERIRSLDLAEGRVALRPAVSHHFPGHFTFFFRKLE